MSELHDYDLYDARQGQGPAAVEQRSSRHGYVILLALVIGTIIGAAAYLLLRPRPIIQTPPAGARASTEESIDRPTKPRGAEPLPVALPPLDESDAFVRQFVSTLSSHPKVAAWLVTPGLVRSFVVVVSNIADGRSPARHLGTLRPAGDFLITDRSGTLAVDPRSYDRYSAIAAAAESIDTAGAARLYVTLRPLLEDAARDLGGPDASFDATLERAIVRLLETNVPDGPVRLEPRGLVYKFASTDLESLTPAQKQLLRFGPDNVRRIQTSLRQFAVAIGIPAERLPAVPTAVHASGRA